MHTENNLRSKQQLQQLRSILPGIFGEMDEVLFHSILPYLEWKELPGNEHLFHQGDKGDSLFILISGRLQVLLRHTNGIEEIVGEVTRGETVGEMAIFTGELRSASIVAVRDSVLIRISRQSFEEMASQYPAMLMNITRLIIKRLKKRNANERNLTKVVNIALVPLGKGVDIRAFASLLKTKMQSHGNILHLSTDTVNQFFLKDGIAHSLPDSESYHQLSIWLDEQEVRHDYMIYEAEYNPSEWTKRCLRQADEIILIANTTDDPAAKEIERNLLSGLQKLTTASQVLVLLHKHHDAEVRGTQNWISRRELKAHHHLVNGSEKDMERFARYLTGNSIGLVLSGGGAKGLAHIGIYRALKEHNIPIDMAGGTSIGSIIGGGIAMCWPPEKLYEVARAGFLSNPTPVSDYNLLPFVSLLKGRKIDRLLKDFLGEMIIEDMWLNYFCISSDLTKTRAVVHRQGSLFQAVRASISLPGVFPPVILNKSVHIDGGIFNNLPIDVLEEMGAGYIAAVNLDTARPDDFELNAIPTSWQILKSRFWGKRIYDIPSLMSTLIQSTTLNSDQKTRQMCSRAGLYFAPDLRKYGLVEWKAFDKIVEIGYQHAKNVLEEWEGF